MAQLVLSDCLGYGARSSQDSFPPKSGGDLGAAVDSGDGHILLEAAKLQGLLDDRREVFAAVNMDDARIGHQGGGKHPVRVRGFGRHQAVGGKKHRGGKVRKFLLLILPCGSEIAFQMAVFSELRVGVGGKHFPVGVYVDSPALGLFQQKL